MVNRLGAWQECTYWIFAGGHEEAAAAEAEEDSAKSPCLGARKRALPERGGQGPRHLYPPAEAQKA